MGSSRFVGRWWGQNEWDLGNTHSLAILTGPWHYREGLSWVEASPVLANAAACLPAHSDTLWTGEYCHFIRHHCHCKQTFTVSGVAVSGQTCTCSMGGRVSGWQSENLSLARDAAMSTKSRFLWRWGSIQLLFWKLIRKLFPILRHV